MGWYHGDTIICCVQGERCLVETLGCFEVQLYAVVCAKFHVARLALSLCSSLQMYIARSDVHLLFYCICIYHDCGTSLVLHLITNTFTGSHVSTLEAFSTDSMV